MTLVGAVRVRNIKNAMEIDDQKKKVLDFIKSKRLAVLSTLGTHGFPEAAVVGISELEDLSLIFGTFNTFRKYKNIKTNPRVALVIGWDNHITLQYEGIATELTGDEKKKAEQVHIHKLPNSQKFAELPEQCYFKVKPTWIRYTDYSNESVYVDVFEITF